MSMMNANAAATTAMTANEPLDFELPEMGDSDFSNEELAEDMDGLTMSFPRIKIPAGGVLQFEIPNGDPQHPDYSPTLTGVILFSHASCVYWPEGDEYSDDVPPLCSSVDGKQGYGEPGGVYQILHAPCVVSQDKSGFKGFQSALIPYFQQGVAQLVQLVDVLTFVEMIVEPQHIAVKAGKEHFAVPFPVYPDFGKGGLQLLCRHGEMYRCPYLNPH